VDALYFAESTLKFIRERIKVLKEQITEGSVPDFNAYQKLRAQYEAWVSMEEHIISLLKRNGFEDEQPNSARPRS
jgi:hypothetical protein